MCRIILTYETAAARSVVPQKRGFPAHFVIRQGHLWKIIISPEFGDKADLKKLTRDVLAQH